MNVSTLNETVTEAAGKAQKSQGVTVQSFLTSLIVYGGICVAAVTYELMQNSAGSRRQPWPSAICDPSYRQFTSKWLAWLVRTLRLRVNEQRAIHEVRIDAYLFLRFLRTIILILVPLSLVVLSILLPLDITANGDSSITGLDRLSWSNLQTQQASRYWGHFLTALLIVAYVGYVLLTEFREYIRIRQQYLLTAYPGQRYPGKLVLLTDIPTEKLSEEAIAKDYSKFGVEPSMVVINRNLAGLTVSIGERRKLVLGLERALVGGRSPIRKGIFGKACKRADSGTIWSITAKLHDINMKIAREQELPELFNKLPSAFIRFRDPGMAHLARQAIVNPVPLSMVAHPVACEADIIWSNLSIGWWQRFAKNLLTALSVTALGVVWVIPMAMTGLMSQLVYLATRID